MRHHRWHVLLRVDLAAEVSSGAPPTGRAAAELRAAPPARAVGRGGAGPAPACAQGSVTLGVPGVTCGVPGVHRGLRTAGGAQGSERQGEARPRESRRAARCARHDLDTGGGALGLVSLRMPPPPARAPRHLLAWPAPLTERAESPAGAPASRRSPASTAQETSWSAHSLELCWARPLP